MATRYISEARASSVPHMLAAIRRIPGFSPKWGLAAAVRFWGGPLLVGVRFRADTVRVDGCHSGEAFHPRTSSSVPVPDRRRRWNATFRPGAKQQYLRYQILLPALDAFRRPSPSSRATKAISALRASPIGWLERIPVVAVFPIVICDDVLEAAGLLQFGVRTVRALLDVLQIRERQLTLLLARSSQEFAPHDVGHQLLDGHVPSGGP